LINNVVRIDGSVQRPGNYEISGKSDVSEILKFSGLSMKGDFKVQFSRFNSSSNRREVTLYDDVQLLNNLSLKDGDSINILSSSRQEQANVLVTGEVLYPGYYDTSDGQTISEILEQAGGFTDLSYPEGAIFTRESVREQQKSSYIKNAENLERSLVDAVSSGNQIDGEAYMAISEFIVKLKEQEPMGRQVVDIDDYSLQSDPKLDFILQDGDTIFIPKRSSSISVVGEVLNATTLLFREELSIQDYIDLSGGATEGADLSRIFIILPNGQSLIYKRKLFQNDFSNLLLPGSTIVVSRNPDPYNWLKLTSILTPILSDLAISAASLSAISSDN
jgi:protein involved in polysaccharide export with SLBB domain